MIFRISICKYYLSNKQWQLLPSSLCTYYYYIISDLTRFYALVEEFMNIVLMLIKEDRVLTVIILLT